ncbi:MAG TPA: Ig-like domain-containing protein [Candidatus Saccharimonadales bacterium]|nr:Ig-like domain-containing protein [Candidatus Saccharimonadales bacterium]
MAIFGTAHADTVPSINFEQPAYHAGDINGQNGWTKTGPYDVAVDSVSGFPNASSFGFGDQALRLSNSVTSGSFGDQTFAPSVTEPAGENQTNQHFEASFSIGSTESTQQPGLFLSVSPDNGSGSRMSYVGFDDESDGVHVQFYDVTDPGPLGTVANFNESDVATLNRTAAHTIKFAIDTIPGPSNDVVKLYVDGNLVKTGGSWEDYYHYDPEQSGNGNVVPDISTLLFHEGGTPAPGTAGNGYLVDNVSLASSPIDNTAPTVAFTNPTSFANPFSAGPNVTVSASDSDSGLKTLVIHTYNASDNSPAKFCTASASDLSAGTMSCDLSGLPDGTYYIKAGAFDNAGNNTTINSGNFVIDSSAPDVQITNPTDGSTVYGTVDVRGSVHDANPDHYYLKITRNSNGHVVYSHTYYNPPQNFTDASIFNWDTTAVSDGDYTISLAARDAAGNRDANSEDIVTVSVNNTPNNKYQCKNDGWQNFTKPSFKNQGRCVSWVEHNVYHHGYGHHDRYDYKRVGYHKHIEHHPWYEFWSGWHFGF